MGYKRADQLFSHFTYPSNQNVSSRIKYWIHKNLAVFAIAIVFSLGFHVALFSLFSFLSTSQALKPDNPKKKLETLTQSLHQMHGYYAKRPPSASSQKNNKSQKEKSTAGKKECPQKSQLPLDNPSPSLSLKEAQMSPSSPTQIGKGDYIARANRTRKTPFLAGSRQVRIPTEKGTRYVPAGYFFRKSPYKKILSSGAELFTVIQGFPPLNEEPSIKSSPQKFLPLQKEILQQSSLDKSFPSPPKHSPEFTETPSSPFSLVIAGKKSPQIFNQLMSLSEREQWNQFKNKFLKPHNPDNPQLARLSREFIRQNLTRVFIAINEISVAFDSVEEIYFNKELDQEFYQYWKNHPQSPTGAVFLLTLAAHYHFERKALNSLFKAYGKAQKFLHQKDSRVDIHNKKVKSRVVKKICEDLIKRLKKKGYSSLHEVLHKYKKEESKIYNLLLSMEGKGRKWGLFALGCFEWDENHYRAALNHWQKIDHPDPSNQALQEIQEVLSRRETSAVEKLIPEISSILEYHSRKNNRALLLRMVKFGGWENRKN
ncbi:hypothetical protein KGY73_08330 [bacterium]|nr:hypothetical protein [bacterium]